MNYEFCARTDTGLLRSNNEDAVAFDAANGLTVLADGMGGYNAGEVASSMAAGLVQAGMGRWLAEAGGQASPREVRRALEICVDNANGAILQASQANPQYAGMGTTLVAACFHDNRLVLGHIGDSRGYRLRDGALDQITRDHSWLQEQVDAGIITAEQAAVSPNRNLVTRALGVEEAAQIEVHEHRVEPGDLYLLCSDGLPDMVDDDDIATILRAGLSLEDTARTLIDSANAQGGRDNISVVLIRATASAAGRRGLMSRLFGTIGF
ncbi:Stp1/IreP family PP2C-type Ser/Thr phosphatase [Xylophilus sp.]|uniref:Stp1/IreP family PP2C-type Ser/Thr phosphatase n=1 Tax=Xylophilus sp. TaxID=2653893 RepID=UPI002D7F04C7|nr:Stp1/IreP family PP2C-type Ser/Thr phosphatase [Xylophilus sp.]